MEPLSYLRKHPKGCVLSVKVQPRASKNEICQVNGGELKVRVTAPPVDSAANEEIIRFLAEQLGCSRGALSLVRGQTSRHKQILVEGFTAEKVEQKLSLAGT